VQHFAADGLNILEGVIPAPVFQYGIGPFKNERGMHLKAGFSSRIEAQERACLIPDFLQNAVCLLFIRNADEIWQQFWGGGFGSVKARRGRLVVLKNRCVTKTGAKQARQNCYHISSAFLSKIRRRKYDLLVAGLGSAEKETVKAGLAIG
jgi:hypothetical protein